MSEVYFMTYADEVLLNKIRTYDVDVVFLPTENPDFWKIEGKEFEKAKDYVEYIERILNKFEKGEITNGDVATIIILLTFEKIKVICLDLNGYPSVVVKNE
jgi:hypothetical protein